MKITKWMIIFMLFLCSGQLSANSLFNAEKFESLAGDNRAHKVGDVLTILVTETAVASTSATTSTNKSSGVSGSVGFPIASGEGDISLGQEFAGGGSVERSGRLLATLTVSVQEVYENGDLLVKGEQNVELNEELQRIFIEGRVRPNDISTDNTVLSTRVGDAKITYDGDGVLGEKQKPSFFSKLITLFGFLI